MSALDVHAILTRLDQLDLEIQIRCYSTEYVKRLRDDMLCALSRLEQADIEA